MKPEVRKAQREQAIRALKEKNKSLSSKKKTAAAPAKMEKVSLFLFTGNLHV